MFPSRVRPLSEARFAIIEQLHAKAMPVPPTLQTYLASITFLRPLAFVHWVLSF